MRDVFTAANRNNAAIYSLDPRGLAIGRVRHRRERRAASRIARALQVTQDTLAHRSPSETDGRAIVNRNDLAGGLAQIVRDSSVYYLIGYNSTQAPTDGKFHEIKVRVKRRGVDVRARKGLLGADRRGRRRATRRRRKRPSRFRHALASIATSVQAGKYVRTWLGTERGENGKTRVTLVWEPLPQPPGVRREQPGACR